MVHVENLYLVFRPLGIQNSTDCLSLNELAKKTKDDQGSRFYNFVMGFFQHSIMLDKIPRSKVR